MTHLDAAEFVDLLEGRLAAPRRRHVEGCAACSARAAAMRGVLAQAADSPVPEPSPLFWQHFSSRVRESVTAHGHARQDGGRGFLRSPAFRWRAALALIAMVVAAAIWRNPAPQTPSRVDDRTARSAVAPAPDGPGDAWNDDLDSDEAWSVVRTVADEVGWEETRDAGITAAPQSAERLVPQLSAEERAELARLLQEELRRSGA